MTVISMLPLDIWLLVCEDLVQRREFDALLSFALTCHTMANLALPKLYSIHELASASADDASMMGKRKLATLWRSIILSSIGETAYPYCLWIKVLKLGDLKELLSDIAPNENLRTSFFEGAMGPFHITPKITRRQKYRLEAQAISNKAGESITAYVKESADRDNRLVALTHLESQYIPTEVLPSWTAKLVTLESLNIQDGSVIGERVAAAIRDNCPRFKELTCFYCNGPDVDTNLAAFFQTLRPNSLRLFSVSSRNRLGKEALSALALHALSLEKLCLSDLQTSTLEHLGLLRPCVNLVRLELGGEMPSALEWHAELSDGFSDTVAWLSNCASLSDLRLWNVPGAASWLKHVLPSAAVKLKTLNLTLVDGDEGAYAGLGHQTSLEELILRSEDIALDTDSPEHEKLMSSLCKCPRLKVLDLLETVVSNEDLAVLAGALGDLEDLSFGNDPMDDAVLETLLCMRKLKSVCISGSTDLTKHGVLSFLDSIAAMGRTDNGFCLYILYQNPDAGILPGDEEFLSLHAQNLLGGRVEISYEEHESDFSD